MHVEEQARVTACKVREVSFWHGADVAPDIFGQVLIMMFLMSEEKDKWAYQPQDSSSERERKNWGGLVGWGHIRTLFRSARRRSCTDRPSYFLNFPKFSTKILSSRAAQSGPTTSMALFSSMTR